MSNSLALDEIVINLAKDLGLDENTLSYVLNRLANEGISFLTKSLPKLSKAVLAGLEEGQMILPIGFANSRNCFSRYFRVWLLRIFDRRGFSLENPDSDSIRKIRQFCDYLYKLTLPMSKETEVEAYQKVIDLEVANKARSASISKLWLEKLRKLFETEYKVFTTQSVSDVLNKHRPHYTSGAFFGSENLHVPSNLYKALPSSTIGSCSKKFRAISGYFRSYFNKHEKIKFVEEGFTSKTILVPKDSRGPRCISKEPLHLLKLQMSYFDFMVKNLEKLTRNRINFLNQDINRVLAQQSSITRENCTLDLKDASDRVLFSVCKHVFRNSPFMAYFFNNVRSTSTIVEGHDVPLYKLAGMGSGLTFPTMALLIHLSIARSVMDRTGLPYAKVAPLIYVYGDDVICPNRWKHIAIQGLEASGLMVNGDKSFSKSFFRESCGGDYFKGVSVSPIRLKLSNSGVSTHTNRIFFKNKDMMYLQLDRHCRELVKANLLNLASHYYDWLDSRLDNYGYTSGDSPTLGRYSVEPIYINDDLIHHRWVAKPITVNTVLGCPYKFLGQRFGSVGREQEGLTFGEIAMPRKIKLVKRQVRSISLR